MQGNNNNNNIYWWITKVNTSSQITELEEIVTLMRCKIDLLFDVCGIEE
jgi:negative regulator of replication initiation